MSSTPTYSQLLQKRMMMWAREANKTRFSAATQEEFRQPIYINRKHQGYGFARDCGVAHGLAHFFFCGLSLGG